MFVERGCVHDSFAAPLKDLCSSIFGWERSMLEGDTTESRDFRETPDMFWTKKLGVPHFTPRLALQLLGTEVLRNHFDQDIWLNSLEYRIRKQIEEMNQKFLDEEKTKKMKIEEKIQIYLTNQISPSL